MNFLINSKIPQHEGEISQIPSATQRKMISALAAELTESEYHEICHQLHGTKSEFDEIDGECDVPHNKYEFTVRSALYRGIFWQTLKKLDECKAFWKKFDEAEAEWLEEPDEYDI